MRDLPKNKGDDVYSNFDHSYSMTEEEVKTSNMYHQHSAWDFCGNVWFDSVDELFIEQIWVHHALVREYQHTSLSSVIDAANDEFGHD